MARRSTGEGSRLRVISTLSPQQVLSRLIPALQDRLACQVELRHAAGSVLATQLAPAAGADVFIGPPSLTEDFLARGLLVAGSQTVLAHSPTALATGQGALAAAATPAQLADLLSAAPTVSFSHGPSGRNFLALLQDLGLLDAVLPKAVMPAPGETVAQVLARGQAHLGISQLSELLPTPGLSMVPLPVHLQPAIACVASLVCGGARPEAGAELVRLLRLKPTWPVWRDCGFEPCASGD